MLTLLQFYWPVLAAGLVIGLLVGRRLYVPPKRTLRDHNKEK
ncbi:hypothetical protein ABDK56_06990 [Sphingomonas sp. ASV193]